MRVVRGEPGRGGEGGCEEDRDAAKRTRWNEGSLKLKQHHLENASCRTEDIFIDESKERHVIKSLVLNTGTSLNGREI